MAWRTFFVRESFGKGCPRGNPRGDPVIDARGNAKRNALGDPGGQNRPPSRTGRVGLVGHGRHGKTDLPTVRCTLAEYRSIFGESMICIRETG